MAVRLVYNPKCWVYTKTAQGDIYDLTNYVTGGKIERNVDQLSYAEVKLRNPNKIFTNPAEGVAFHPMDPITIFLERIENHPVRVFTGFLDTTPYYQMFPGEITIKASCTLKRLLHIYFDPALPYFYSFLTKFGWFIKEDGTAVNAKSFEGRPKYPNETKEAEELRKGEEKEERETKEEKRKKQKEEEKDPKAKKEKEEFKSVVEKDRENSLTVFGSNEKELKKGEEGENDSSLGRLLWALLYFVAQLRDEHIYIEALPPAVHDNMLEILRSLNAGAEIATREVEADKAYTQFLHEVLGTSAQGSASPNANITGSGNLKSTEKVIQTLASVADKKGIPPAYVVCTCIIESAHFAQSAITSENFAGCQGWFQFKFSGSNSSTPYGNIGLNKSYTKKEAEDVAISANAFCEATLLREKKEFPGALKNPNGSTNGEWQHLAEQTQQPGSGAYNGAWLSDMQEAKKLISQYAGAVNVTGSVNSNEPESKNSEETKRSTSEEESNKPTSTGPNPYSQYFHPLEKAKNVGPARTDEGTDYVSAGSGFNGSPIVAIGNGVVTSYIPGAFEGNILTYQITEPGPLKGQYIYNAEALESTLKKGDKVYGGRQIATINTSIGSHSLEFGYALENGFPVDQVAYKSVPDGTPMPAGKQFTRLMKILGIPGSEDWGNGPVYPSGPHEIVSQGEGGEGEGGGSTDPLVDAKVAAFTSAIQLPSMQELAAAVILTGQKALMNDIPIITMIQQVCQASLRSFMSLPNGDFYAFYPDYFGEFGHHEPYWYIEDIEILDGGIDLSDQYLVTHSYAIGDNTWPATNNELFLEINSAGVVNIFNAFNGGILNRNLKKGEKPQQTKKLKKGFHTSLENTAEAQAFLERYGARPLKQMLPMVRSPMYEMLMAYQSFCLAWSRQFLTPFEFTFMPELFPGGKVGFPDHGIQMYVEKVVHTWDMTSGYRTEAKLSAPAVMYHTDTEILTNQLPENMVAALSDPIKGKGKRSNESGQRTKTPPTVSPPKVPVGNHQVAVNKSGQLH